MQHLNHDVRSGTILDTIRELRRLTDDTEALVSEYRQRLKGRQTVTTQIE